MGFPGGLVLRIHMPMPETQVQSQSGKVPLAPEQLSLCATTTDLVLYSPRAAPAELTSGNY